MRWRRCLGQKMADFWRDEVSRRSSRIAVFSSEPDQERRAATIAAEVKLSGATSRTGSTTTHGCIDPKETTSPARRKVPFILWPRQRELFAWLDEVVANGETGLINKGRELGVSWACIHYIWHKQQFQREFSAALVSRKEALVDNDSVGSLFGKLRFINECQPDFLRSEWDEDEERLIHNANKVGAVTGESHQQGRPARPARHHRFR